MRYSLIPTHHVNLITALRYDEDDTAAVKRRLIQGVGYSRCTATLTRMKMDGWMNMTLLDNDRSISTLIAILTLSSLNPCPNLHERVQNAALIIYLSAMVPFLFPFAGYNPKKVIHRTSVMVLKGLRHRSTDIWSTRCISLASPSPPTT